MRDPGTIKVNCILADKHLFPLIGGIKLTELTADDVDNWLDGLSTKLASNTLQKLHANLKRPSGKPRRETRCCATSPS